jgi:inosine/xanthosine triphosphatase
MKMNIVIASTNPTKIDAIRIGFSRIYPNDEFAVMGVSVPSGVPDQPMTDQETLQGANNRVSSVRKGYPDADFWAGIEGGIDRMENGMVAFAWVVIESSAITGKARSGTFFLPQPIVDLIDQGKELGEADDIVFNRRDSKKANGAIGILTNDVIDRTELYATAVILALAPFIHPNLYQSLPES